MQLLPMPNKSSRALDDYIGKAARSRQYVGFLEHKLSTLEGHRRPDDYIRQPTPDQLERLQARLVVAQRQLDEALAARDTPLKPARVEVRRLQVEIEQLHLALAPLGWLCAA